jgi:hypothetical protein
MASERMGGFVENKPWNAWLLAANHVGIARLFRQESAGGHPVDLLLKLGGLVALDAE